jgi:hypothetical protein
MPDVRKTFADAGYIVIGLGVMGFQQAQVRRRELQDHVGTTANCFGDRARDARQQIGDRARDAGQQVGDRARDAREQISGLAGDVSQRVEPIVERFGDLSDLPEFVNKAVEPFATRVRVIVRRAA